MSSPTASRLGPGRVGVRVCALACLLTSLALVGHALLLGFSIEATPQQTRDSAHGQAIAVAAVPAGVLALVALVAASRRGAWIVLLLAAVLTAAALVVDLTGVVNPYR